MQLSAIPGLGDGREEDMGKDETILVDRREP